MHTEPNREVGKLINYFENYINDLNKDPSQNSKNNSQQIRTTSQNTSHFTFSFAGTPQPISTTLPTIHDEDDLYDRLTYQTLIHSNSYSSPEHSTVNSVKRRRRRQLSDQQTTRKRLHRRRPPPPTYIKELKAYLAHRQSTVADSSKISDVKKFSNVLVWLSNQTTSPSFNETSTAISIKDNDHSHTITADSVIGITQSDSGLVREKHPGHDTTRYLTYQSIKWKIRIRKEVFSPMESFDQPSLIELLYFQIIRDVFSSTSIRISEVERTNMKTFLCKLNFTPTPLAYPLLLRLASHGVSSIVDMHSIESLVLKKSTIEQARQWSLYFSRLFPIISTQHLLFAISHSGIRLIGKNRVIESYTFDCIQHLSPIKNPSTMKLFLTKKKITIQSNRIEKIREMIEKFVKEFRMLNSSTSFVSGNESTDCSMMEFALQYFQSPNKRQSKKKSKTKEWTWQDYSELMKWSKTPISIPLLRHSPTNLSRQCFLTIMRFMGDHPLTRNQTDSDCIFLLLKSLRKSTDEIFCQMIKQLTDNQSSNANSREKGWKLLMIMLNYFIPTDDLRVYFGKFLNANSSEKLGQLCLIHYEQTLKHEGRKTFPSKAELDFLVSVEGNGKNAGKRQLFLLPGGLPLTLTITPSMVIDDCLRLLCEQLETPSTIDRNEYSIFLISTSKYSSRLLSPNEYLFDLFNECFRLRLFTYHLILKRMLWCHIPMEFNEGKSSEIFLDFMYYQSIPQYLEGLMIICENNRLSNELMKEVSFLTALIYRNSNKTNLPTIREVKHLLPSTVLQLKDLHPKTWIENVHEKLRSTVLSMSLIEAKREFLNRIQTWPLFGTTFFSIQSTNHSPIRTPCFLGINKSGISFLQFHTREMMFMISYQDLTSISNQQNVLEIKYGPTIPPNHLQCQMKRAQDLVLLTKRYWKF